MNNEFIIDMNKQFDNGFSQVCSQNHHITSGNIFLYSFRETSDVLMSYDKYFCKQSNSH